MYPFAKKVGDYRVARSAVDAAVKERPGK